MKRLKFDICKSNTKWFYKSLNRTQVEGICAKNECKVDYNKNLLNSKCRKNCDNEYYDYRIVSQKILNKDYSHKMFIIWAKRQKKENLTFIRRRCI